MTPSMNSFLQLNIEASKTWQEDISSVRKFLNAISKRYLILLVKSESDRNSSFSFFVY